MLGSIHFAVGATEKDDSSAQELTKVGHKNGTCENMKSAYKQVDCWRNPSKVTNLRWIPMNARKSETANPCNETKPKPGSGLTTTIASRGTFLTPWNNLGSKSLRAWGRFGIQIDEAHHEQHFKKTPCPVNVQRHLCNEHYSLGKSDEAENALMIMGIMSTTAALAFSFSSRRLGAVSYAAHTTKTIPKSPPNTKGKIAKIKVGGN